MHSYLGEQELGQRWILAACEHTVRSDEELPPRGVCLSSRVGAHRQCNCRPQLAMLFTSVLNGCLPSWPNFVSVHSLSLLPFLPSLSSTASEKQNIFEMPLSGGPRQILAALPVVVAQLSIISTDVRKHPVPTAQETPQPHRREDPCLCGLPLRSACRRGAPPRFRRWRLPRQYTSRQERRLGKRPAGIPLDRVCPSAHLQRIRCP